MPPLVAIKTKRHALLHYVAFVRSSWLVVEFFARLYIAAAYYAAMPVPLVYDLI